MSDRDFLMFIFNRLHYIHEENRNVDYMRRLYEIADNASQESK